MPTLVFFLSQGHLAPSRKYVHMSKNGEIVSKNIFHLIILLLVAMIIFVLFCSVSKSHCINA